MFPTNESNCDSLSFSHLKHECFFEKRIWLSSPDSGLSGGHFLPTGGLQT